MTYTKEEARIEIQKLVEDFRAHEATLEKAAEAQIENNFIRPLFSFLNWNTENRGLSHAHYEFKLQVTNKKGLRPDYILNLEGRDVLVMDAKQVKYSMKDSRWLYQVYSYAYSTQNSKPSEKIDFAILTDFQEFIVLDCTLFAAKPEAVNNFRVLDWTYNDYVEKFDELWELLERNKVLNDSKERKSGLWSRYLSPQKVKANRISPDKAFLAEMDNEKDGWRVLLAKDMKKHNLSADGELITAAVQLLIDRLVFIKALSDREVDKDYLGELARVVEENGLSEDDTSWFKACKNIFDELNNFYNGSIFAPRPELENVSVSNKVVQSVITDLQPENSPYNFAVLPVEILGTIYERFLGRVVRTTDKRVTIEEKPEVRKAGGVYYTPQYIVDYIVENTLGSLLNECKSPADVSKLKILDPACGSGSFLLGAYSKLIQWHKDYFARAGKEKRDRESFYKDESGQIRLTAKLKRDILKNNLFGVDIDPQAVEVTRFSLSLKALEDLREGELTEERSLFHQTVLPDLSANIKNGNSLIGTDYFAGKMFSDTEEMKRVNAFDWESEFKEIMGNGGFDVVIGNPPYVQASLIMEYKEYFKNTFATYSGNSDLYVFFVEKSFKLLHKSGQYGMIVSNKWLKADYGSNLRRHLAKTIDINQLIDFGELPVFQGIGTFPCIVIGNLKTKEGIETKYTPVKRLPPKDDLESQIQELSFAVDLSHSDAPEWVLVPKNIDKILDKINNNGIKLCNYPGLTIRRGVVTGFNPAFIVNEGTKNKLIKEHKSANELIMPFVSGDETRRYLVSWQKRYVIFSRRGIDITSYPSILSHLSNWRKELEPRKKNTKDSVGRKPGIYKWYEVQDSTSYYQDFDKPKIVYGQFQIAPHFCFSPTTLYFGSNHYMMVHDDTSFLYYLLGILNSKLYFFYMKRVAGVLGDADDGGRLISQKSHILKFPIRTINPSETNEKSQHEKMVSLVTQMLELHKSKADAKTQSEQDVYERQIKSVDEGIDSLVYALYGLSEEEIKIVKGK